jgi:hypothetical protein
MSGIQDVSIKRVFLRGLLAMLVGLVVVVFSWKILSLNKKYEASYAILIEDNYEKIAFLLKSDELQKDVFKKCCLSNSVYNEESEQFQNDYNEFKEDLYFSEYPKISVVEIKIFSRNEKEAAKIAALVVDVLKEKISEKYLTTTKKGIFSIGFLLKNIEDKIRSIEKNEPHIHDAVSLTEKDRFILSSMAAMQADLSARNADLSDSEHTILMEQYLRNLVDFYKSINSKLVSESILNNVGRYYYLLALREKLDLRLAEVANQDTMNIKIIGDLKAYQKRGYVGLISVSMGVIFFLLILIGTSYSRIKRVA